MWIQIQRYFKPVDSNTKFKKINSTSGWMGVKILRGDEMILNLNGVFDQTCQGLSFSG